MQKPTSTNGRRLAAAMFLGAASTAMVAGTAHADGVKGATVDQGEEAHGYVHMTGDTDPRGSYTTLIGLDAPGSSTPLLTYCIQKTVELNPDETYDEHSWSEETSRTGIDSRHLEGIKWILNNSYPQLDLGPLAKAAGIGGSLTAGEAVEGTQAAIWNLSDASGKTTLDTQTEKQEDAKVVTLYNYLVNMAGKNMHDPSQPKASLAITAQTAAAHAGSKVALTLTSPKTSGSFISVTLADTDKTGAKLVDADGKAIAPGATFKSGDVVYVQLPSTPATGAVTVTATGTVSGIEAGRVFVSSDGSPSQNLILAQAQSTPVSATAVVNWAPAAAPTTTPGSSPSTAPSTHPSTPGTKATPTPSTTPTGGLAHTGAGETVPLAGGALTLLAAGGGMMVYTRRNRKQSTHS